MTSSTPARELARIASRQHGNATTAQLHAAGFSKDQITRRAAAGWLQRRHTGVYAVGHRPRTRESVWMAAVLALGVGAALSHRAAGALWEIVRGAVLTDVLIPPGAGRGSRDGIVVHRATVRADEVTVRDGIPVTSLVRTVMDLAAVQTLAAFSRSFEEAQVRHALSPDDLAVEVLSRRRHRGNGRLATVLTDAVDPAHVRSMLELRFLQLCDAHGIPRPLVNERFGRWEMDFMWPGELVVVETDGLRFHRTAAQRRRDQDKDAFLRAAGFEVIRLTWADVTETAGVVATRLGDVLSA